MQAADKSDAIICAITRDGKTYLNTTQLAPEDMPAKVKDLLSSRLWLWEVCDNLRKGAATNAVQIAEEMMRRALC